MSWTRREVARWQRTSGTSVSSHLRGIRMWRVADGPNRTARSASLRASTCCPSAQQGHACRITNFVWTFDSLTGCAPPPPRPRCGRGDLVWALGAASHYTMAGRAPTTSQGVTRWNEQKVCEWATKLGLGDRTVAALRNVRGGPAACCLLHSALRAFNTQYPGFNMCAHGFCPAHACLAGRS